MNQKTWKKIRRRVPQWLALSFIVLMSLHPVIAAVSVQATTPIEAVPPQKTPEQLAREQKLKQLTEADRLLQAGDKAAAETLYRAVKPAFQGVAELPIQTPLTDPAQLPPAGKVYWREAQAGIAQNLQTRIFVPLELLTKNYPQFLPGQITYATVLEKAGKKEQALAILERAATLYPNQPELVKAKITALGNNDKWIEASVTARQFALLNPSDPQAAEFKQLADETLKRYQSQLRSKLNSNLIGNILTGAIGFALTGSLFGPLNSVQNTVLLLRGESAVGERVVKQAHKVLDLVEDQEINEYVNSLGQKLANAGGRSEFKYEFYVVLDDQLNAFALPGGKVFINAGAISKANSEAELAGLLGHELSHAILSHSFQLISDGSLTANLTQFIPYIGGLLNDISTLSYSRDMERQADILGTRLIASTGYAADGLRNLMATLRQDQDAKGKPLPPRWLASHPFPKDRVEYLEALIHQTGYNRYAYEGIERHTAIQARVEQAMKAYKESEKYKEKKRLLEN